MFSNLFPDALYENIYEIDISDLKGRGISGLIFDIDNTIAKPSEKQPSDRLMKWLSNLQRDGFSLCILSNAGDKRVKKFSEGLNIHAELSVNDALNVNAALSANAELSVQDALNVNAALSANDELSVHDALNVNAAVNVQDALSVQEALNVHAVYQARKPSRKGFQKAMETMGLSRDRVCMIGDQLFTDIYGAKRLGIYSIYTKPLVLWEVFTVMLKRIPEFIVLQLYYRSRRKRENIL